jgi:hypothetical protein
LTKASDIFDIYLKYFSRDIPVDKPIQAIQPKNISPVFRTGGAKGCA